MKTEHRKNTIWSRDAGGPAPPGRGSVARSPGRCHHRRALATSRARRRPGRAAKPARGLAVASASRKR